MSPCAGEWGSKAVNGVINIITLSAKDSKGGNIAAGAGNDTTGAMTVRYGAKTRGIGAYRVFAESFHFSELPTFVELDPHDEAHLIRGGLRGCSRSKLLIFLEIKKSTISDVGQALGEIRSHVIDQTHQIKPFSRQCRYDCPNPSKALLLKEASTFQIRYRLPYTPPPIGLLLLPFRP
jgi:hypothetical protein